LEDVEFEIGLKWNNNKDRGGCVQQAARGATNILLG
jgi:hypothetical protein